MKLSIIIPYYNANRWIGRMLKSLLIQDLAEDEYEVIVVDDGSEEKPLVLKSYCKRYSNVQYVRQKNSGPGAARNTGISVARGEFIMFCDSDDYVAENIIGRLYEIAHGRSLDMLFFNVIRVNQGEINEKLRNNFENIQEFATGKDFFALPIYKSFITLGVWQFVIARSFINEHNLRFPTDMIMNEDACFYIDAVLLANKTAKTDIDVYFYVQNPQSLVHYSGKILKTEKFTTNRLMFIKKLDMIIRNQKVINHLPQNCVNNLIWLKNSKSYALLIETCKYLTIRKFNKVLYEINNINSFPKPFGNHLILKKIFLRPIVMRMMNVLFVLKYQTFPISL